MLILEVATSTRRCYKYSVNTEGATSTDMLILEGATSTVLIQKVLLVLEGATSTVLIQKVLPVLEVATSIGNVNTRSCY